MGGTRLPDATGDPDECEGWLARGRRGKGGAAHSRKDLPWVADPQNAQRIPGEPAPRHQSRAWTSSSLRGVMKAQPTRQRLPAWGAAWTTRASSVRCKWLVAPWSSME